MRLLGWGTAISTSPRATNSGRKGRAESSLIFWRVIEALANIRFTSESGHLRPRSTCIHSCEFWPVRTKSQNAAAQKKSMPAIRIVGGVYDELIVKGECGLFQDRERIIGLLNSFRLIVEHAVADKNSQTARRNERTMVGGQCVDRSGEANAVARTTPAVPL